MRERPWRFAGINFDHMHMGDLLRAVHEHPNAEIAGICDEVPERMQTAIRNFGLSADQVHTDVAACLKAAQADVLILCPATADHATYVERVAPSGAHVLLEKPFAASLEEADRIIAAMQAGGGTLMVNWPLRWVAGHVTAKRLIDEGRIGPVREVHYYDGNRGPLYHGADKVDQEPTAERKAASWFYHPDKGGGSLLDYLGYGTTLGTWFHGGAVPDEVGAMVWGTGGLQVDEHSVTVARYAHGLSKFETHWGTFTDPWTHQPQPKCGFVIKGEAGTIASYDYEPTIRLQTREQPGGEDLPVDALPYEGSNPVACFIDCLENGRAPDGPLGIEIARKGQQIVDTALASARAMRVLPLIQ